MLMRVSFARILIEVDVTKDMPRTVVIQDPSGANINQKVIYDWLPLIVKCVRQLDMIVEGCNRTIPDPSL